MTDQQAAECVELSERLDERDARIAELEAASAALAARLADLEERVGRTPRNTSMPPSQEGFSKSPAPNWAERRARKRRPGKQPGVEGKHLARANDPDEVSPHVPSVCSGRGGNLAAAEVVAIERRQVFELPDATSCHRAPHGAPPMLVWALGVGRGTPRGDGSPCGHHRPDGIEAGGGLGQFSDVVTDLLRDAPLVNVDETGARVASRLHWVPSPARRSTPSSWSTSAGGRPPSTRWG